MIWWLDSHYHLDLDLISRHLVKFLPSMTIFLTAYAIQHFG